jgi:hypothetical protein
LVPRTEFFSFAGPDNEEDFYDDYVVLDQEAPTTGMDIFTVMGLIGGIVVVLALLSFCAWCKVKFGVPCCSAAKLG